MRVSKEETESLYQKTMNDKELLDKEREVLKLFPKDELGDIIERR